MNQKVQINIARVIKEWKEGERNYSYETRGLFRPVQIPSGEFLLQFYIVIDGFFEDPDYKKPIKLLYQSNIFLTKTLNTLEDSVRDDIDSPALQSLLEAFTKQAYQSIKDRLASYTQVYTSDIIYMDNCI